WEDSLPKIYQEVYPDDEIIWAANDLGFFGEEGLNSVIQAGQEVDISPELLKKVIDLEVEVSGLGNRRGITNKIESILKQDWESVEVVFDKKIKNDNATNTFKNKRDHFQSMLGEFN
ncbi:uncharacterized protein METZ01_LOCUS141219, partial [marine metagenome]